MSIRRLLLDDQLEPVSHYCHAVIAGPQLWISGTVGIAPDGSIPDDVVEQFDICLRNLDSVLRAADAKREQLVKVLVFLTNIDDRPKINPLRQRYFGEHRPASSLVEVTALIKPELKVELEAEAWLG